ncbi:MULTISPECIES: lysoplasmalogenase family protein [unclassified Microbacterium]|uniref:lysoplasmalogenase family protein n=1 Tax=unclassified Microbacterium TaxID=2609290 RepID=UPI000EA87833|nr:MULTISPECIES: lysoplasmalogenase family protein [unclassified Microbacterium]MBT2486654.1 lysoplasmalogenase [Microbacterium sp. ISL-108]RKN69338.1 lysoplasmalogenase [Microbacterium sp. CGR2]
MQRRTLPPPILWAFVPYIVAAAVHITLLALDSPGAGPTKLLLMPLLALPVLLSAPRLVSRTTLILLLGALLFSWLGDGAGAFFPTAPELPLMLLFFGIAHLAYILLFARHLARRRMPWWALVYAVWWVAMLAVLGPHTGGLLIAVALYGLLLGGTAAFAARCNRLVAVGGAFFLLSDTVLAVRLFLPDVLPSWSSPAVMLTYTIGQGLIIAGALATLRKKDG